MTEPTPGEFSIDPYLDRAGNRQTITGSEVNEVFYAASKIWHNAPVGEAEAKRYLTTPDGEVVRIARVEEPLKQSISDVCSRALIRFRGNYDPEIHGPKAVIYKIMYMSDIDLYESTHIKISSYGMGELKAEGAKAHVIDESKANSDNPSDGIVTFELDANEAFRAVTGAAECMGRASPIDEVEAVIIQQKREEGGIFGSEAVEFYKKLIEPILDRLGVSYMDSSLEVDLVNNRCNKYEIRLLAIEPLDYGAGGIHATIILNGLRMLTVSRKIDPAICYLQFYRIDRMQGGVVAYKFPTEEKDALYRALSVLLTPSNIRKY